MSNIFSQAQFAKPGRNTFDLSHQRKFSGNMGQLLPVFLMDVVPSDKVTIKTDAMIRFAPMVAPIMHQVTAYVHFFFVPNRILWPNWEKFITGGEDGQDQSAPPTLQIDLQASGTSSLFDYFGLPVGQDAVNPDDPQSYVAEVSALPFAAYQKIWNDYYRDENLQAEVTDELVDGVNPQTGGITRLQYRSWGSDRYTKSLPWTQRGPEALLPIGGQAPLVGYNDTTPNAQFPLFEYQRNSADGTLAAPTTAVSLDMEGASSAGGTNDNAKSSAGSFYYSDITGLGYADLAQATATSVIELRRVVKLQEWLEKAARGGARYVEHLMVFWGIKPQDSRLQRAEFGGGMSLPVSISEVLQTSASGFEGDLNALTPQGNMAGHGVGVGAGKPIAFNIKEHGYIIGIMSVRPKTAYQQGVPKHFLRRDKYDYFWPQFQHIGEEAVENQEIFVGSPQREGTFGYVPRYSDYKYMPDTVHGDFRESLDFWHMGRKFASPPALNEDFIKCDTTSIDERIFAVTEQSVQKLWCQMYHQVKANRPMAYFGNPKW